MKEQNRQELMNDNDFQDMVGCPNDFFDESHDSICSEDESQGVKSSSAEYIW